MSHAPLTRTSIQLLLREPFYAHILTGLCREVSTTAVPALGLACREDHFVLHVNPCFWEEQLTDEEHRCGALKHEILHLLFRHPLQRRMFADPFLYHVAADLVVNQYLTSGQRPEGAITPAVFPELALEPDQTTSYYYERLEEVWKGPDSPTRKRLRDWFGERDKRFASHRFWLSVVSPLEEALLTGSLRTALEAAQRKTGEKAIGRFPAGLLRALAHFARPAAPQVDWRRALRLFVQRSSRTRLKNTIRRPSKRYGTTPGIALRRQHRLVVAVDTSGSIGEEELRAFFSEIRYLWRHGVEIRIVENDAALRRVWDYRGQRPPAVYGGGGTRFDPVLEYANELTGFDGVVFFTDGYGPAPAASCRLPLLWVISEGGIDREHVLFNQLPGRKVKMEHKT